MNGAERQSGQEGHSTTVKSAPGCHVGNAKDAIPVVILNWNGEDDTLECLKSIRRSVPAGIVPVVVDNGSAPESLERLKRECGQIFDRILFLGGSELAVFSNSRRAEVQRYFGEDSMVFIETGENLGFAKGNNVGIQFAELAGAGWVMLLNNDTVVAPEMFRELRRFQSAQASYVAMTPQIRYYEPSTRIQNCGGDLTYFGSRKYRYAGVDASTLPESDYSPVTFVTGCALLFKYTVTGPLSEDFFFGEEDYEFSLRMKKLGLKMACVHSAVVYHKIGTSIARSSRPLGGILVQYVSRLINTRNYYSRVRWQVTRVLAYLYLPVLLAKNGIDPRSTVSAIQRIEAHLRRSCGINAAEFRAIACLR